MNYQKTKSKTKTVYHNLVVLIILASQTQVDHCQQHKDECLQWYNQHVENRPEWTQCNLCRHCPYRESQQCNQQEQQLIAFQRWRLHQQETLFANLTHQYFDPQTLLDYRAKLEQLQQQEESVQQNPIFKIFLLKTQGEEKLEKHLLQKTVPSLFLQIIPKLN